MQEEIQMHLDDPAQLERLYRSNRNGFKKAFDAIYPELAGSSVAACWYERLNYSGSSTNWGTQREIIVVSIAALVAALTVKLPDILHIQQENFFQRDYSFVLFPALTAYFGWKHGWNFRRLIPVALIFMLSVVHINLLPAPANSDTTILTCIHLPVFLWTVLGYVFTGDDIKDVSRRMEFLRYNGDVLVFTIILCLAGGALSMLTIGLFSLIGLHIEAFYVRYVLISGFAAVPVVSTYIVRNNPQMVEKISPMVARVFTPLVLIMLTVFLFAFGFSPKDIYNDREFLLLFNLLLIGVTALVFFSVAESPESGSGKATSLVLFMLTVVTLLIAAIALSAIIFRTIKGGMTPNRLAVAGTNLLMLINLLMLSYRLLLSVRRRESLNAVGNAIASYLPVYAIWTAIVAFIFPFLFGHR